MMKKRRMDSNQESPIQSLPDELIFSMFVLLPAKTLMQFKTVCKAWHALIRDSYLAESHRTNSQTRPDSSCLLIHIMSKYLEPWMIYPVNLHDRVLTNQLPTHTGDNTGGEPCISIEKPFSSIVNGLICLWSWMPRRIELLNLTTTERITLPHPPANRYGKPFFCLGFDPIYKQYKVLCSGKTTRKNYVITLGSNMSWKKVSNLPWVKLSRSNTCIDGAIYWSKDISVGDKRMVQYFDIAEEKFKLLCIHDQVGNRFFDMNFVTEIGGNFTWAGLRKSGLPEIHITLWTLTNKRDHVWVMSEIELPSWLIPNEIILRRNIGIVGSTNNGEILIKSYTEKTSILKKYKGALIFCDLENKGKYERIPFGFEEVNYSARIIGFDVSLHVENILPLNFPNEPPARKI